MIIAKYAKPFGTEERIDEVLDELAYEVNFDLKGRPGKTLQARLSIEDILLSGPRDKKQVLRLLEHIDLLNQTGFDDKDREALVEIADRLVSGFIQPRHINSIKERLIEPILDRDNVDPAQLKRLEGLTKFNQVRRNLIKSRVIDRVGEVTLIGSPVVAIAQRFKEARRQRNANRSAASVARISQRVGRVQ
jgi:hypothetical protein